MLKPKFRAIPNEIFWALMRARLSGSGYQIVLTVIDRTLGFVEKDGITRREKAPISLTHFMNVTGLSRTGVNNAIKQAEAAHIISVERKGTKKNIHALNMDTSEWSSEQALTSKLVDKCVPDWSTDVHQTSTLPTNGTIATKETLKDIYIKKEDVPSKEGFVLTDNLLLAYNIKDIIASKQGYPFTNVSREYNAIRSALTSGYTQEEIVGCWEKMKAETQWQDKQLSVLPILGRLGEYRKQHTEGDRSAEACLSVGEGD